MPEVTILCQTKFHLLTCPAASHINGQSKPKSIQQEESLFLLLLAIKIYALTSMLRVLPVPHLWEVQVQTLEISFCWKPALILLQVPSTVTCHLLKRLCFPLAILAFPPIQRPLQTESNLILLFSSAYKTNYFPRLPCQYTYLVPPTHTHKKNKLISQFSVYLCATSWPERWCLM